MKQKRVQIVGLILTMVYAAAIVWLATADGTDCIQVQLITIEAKLRDTAVS